MHRKSNAICVILWAFRHTYSHTHDGQVSCVSQRFETYDARCEKGKRYSKTEQPNIVSSDIGRSRHEERKPYNTNSDSEPRSQENVRFVLIVTFFNFRISSWFSLFEFNSRENILHFFFFLNKN